MPMKPEIEEEIRGYLRGLKDEKTETRLALEKIANLFVEHDLKDERRHTEIMDRFVGHGARLSALERNKSVPPPSAAASGSMPAISRDLNLKASPSGMVNLGDVNQELSERLLEAEAFVSEAREKAVVAEAREQATRDLLAKQKQDAKESAEENRKAWGLRIKIALVLTTIISALAGAAIHGSVAPVPISHGAP